MIAGLRPRREWAGAADLAIDRAEVLRYLGYKPGRTRMTPRAEAAVAAGMERAIRLLAPRAALVDCAVVAGAEAGLVRTAAGPAWRSRALAKVLQGAAAVTVVAATVGAELEQAVARAFRDQEYAEATVMDAVGSAAVHAWLALLRQRLGTRAAAVGLTLTEAFSPGYGDWDIQDQHGLLHLTDAEGVGLICTPTCYLQPQKSVVAVLGWAPAAAGPPLVGCRVCSMRDCTFRLAAQGENGDGPQGDAGPGRAGV